MNPAALQMPQHAESIRVRGLVQGVGFRPAVWLEARRLGIRGEVLNDGAGVLIIAQSSPQSIDALVRRLELEPPALARIDSIERHTVILPLGYDDFAIQQSVADAVTTGFVADAAACDACVAEIHDPADRRAGYAFANCTHCGPRLSIGRDIPYDRANTSMAPFVMCARCRAEYEDPADRRFHAQPNACPDCGPRLELCDRDGRRIAAADSIGRAADLIRRGFIVAIKGLGGFQLACSAVDQAAVAELRRRKRRPHKPLAMMAASIDQLAAYCEVSEAERSTLRSPAAPIALLARGPGAARLASAIAPGQPRLGFMLPNSPLHHLILQRLEAPIVLTSGNRSGQPQCIDNRQALEDLRTVADYFLLHDREIVNRVDDSVVRVEGSRTHFYRRARGYAPAPLALPRDLPASRPILACGGELKNTFCLARERQATLSQYIGDLEDARTCADFEASLGLFRRLFQFDPECVAVDMHPEYLSSKYGRALAEELGIRLVEVQHHHAHIAACLADNGWEEKQGRVIGIALDGLGFGNDGSIWGGEFLLADYRDFERIARLKPAPMPGGTRAIVEPWRNTYAQLQAHANWTELARRYPRLQLVRRLAEKPLGTLERMMQAGLNSPPTSSCGRLFDAFAAAVGICADAVSYEGQAAIELENSLPPDWREAGEAYRFELEDNGLLEIDPGPMWSQTFADLESGLAVAEISARFHRGLARAIVDTALRISESAGVTTVALSGGVFQNHSLLTRVRDGLEDARLRVLFHQQVPANDGGLSLGQAAVAAARINRSE